MKNLAAAVLDLKGLRQFAVFQSAMLKLEYEFIIQNELEKFQKNVRKRLTIKNKSDTLNIDVSTR